MKDISIGIFGAGIAWNFIFLGCLFAIVLIIIDRLLEKREAGFRLPVLAVAIGVYLPLGLSVLIFVGGVLAYVVDRKHRGEREAHCEDGRAPVYWWLPVSLPVRRLWVS